MGRLFFLAVAVVWACGDASGAPPDCSGDERCPCFENQTCNSGLQCLSDTCVRLDANAGGSGEAGGEGPNSGGQVSANGGSSGTQDPGGADSGDAGSPVSGTSGGSPNGGAQSNGGALMDAGAPSGSGNGGSPATGGSTTSGGSQATGGTTSDVEPVPCESGVRNGITACTAPCYGGICGLQDLGTRDCACRSQIYECASCQFPSHPVLDAPAEPLPACTDATDGAYCSAELERCMLDTEVCACLSGLWDCDDPPWERLPCPTSAPTSGDSCPATGLGACIFDGVYCACAAEVWQCD